MQSVAMPGNRKKRTSSRQNTAENWILLETNWRYLLLACVGSLCCHTCNFRCYKWVRCFGTGSCIDDGYNQHKNALRPHWELLCFFAKSFLVKHSSSHFHPSTTTTSFFTSLNCLFCYICTLFRFHCIHSFDTCSSKHWGKAFKRRAWIHEVYQPKCCNRVEFWQIHLFTIIPHKTKRSIPTWSTFSIAWNRDTRENSLPSVKIKQKMDLFLE